MENFSEFRKSVHDRYAVTQHTWVRSIVRYPVTNCVVQWCILLFLSVIVVAGGFFAFADLGLNDFTIIGEQDTRNFIVIDTALDLVEAEGEIEAAQVNFREEQIFAVSFLFLFTVSDGDLLIPETVQEICEVERLVTGQELFPFYCETDNPQGDNTTCADSGEQFAISTSFYPDLDDRANCPLLSQAEIDEIFDELEDGVKEFIVDDPVVPTVARSLISLAGPLGSDSPPFKDFEDVFEDFDDEQVTGGYQVLFEDFIDDIFDFYDITPRILRGGFFTNFFQKSGSTLRTQTGGTFLDILGFDEFIVVDQALSAGSYLVVLCVMSLYIKSCLLACLSIMAIAISMCVGLFLFAIILQIDYFTPMNILVLFLIAGLGADNVFVLVDAWRQSEEQIKKFSRDETENPFLKDLTEVQKTRYLRLNYAYGRAALSVSHTAITTFIAFISTLSSPIGVIAGLGLFGAMVILTNLWYMFTVHPVDLMFVHHVTGRCKSNPPVEETTQEKKDEDAAVVVEEENHLTRLDKAFEKYIFIINETYFPHISFLCMSILGIFMINSTAQLETPASLESNYPLGHMFQDFIIDFNNLFTTGSEESFTEVTACYGIIDLDPGDVKKLSGEEIIGEVEFDENFEIFSNNSQNFILKTCEDLETFPCNEVGCGDFDTLVLEGTVLCPLEFFVDFVKNSNNNFTEAFVDPTVTGAIPNEETFLQLLTKFIEVAPASIGSLFGVFDDRVQFMMMTYRMTMIADQPLGIKEPVIEEFDLVTKDIRERAPDSLRSFFQSSFDHVWQHTERAFVSGLFSGLFISLSASFVVLLIGTKNPRVAFFAIAGVTGVVCSVLGTVRFIPNFALGTAETVAGVFVIGLAIDYIVHLGHMFMHSRTYLDGIKNPDEGSDNLYVKVFGQTGEVAFQNKEMVAFAIRKMGETVLAGAVTTFSAAAFLSLCTFVFFRKMSVLLMLTIFYSVSYAFLFFLPMLKLFGPGRRDSDEFIAQAEKVEAKEK